MPGAPVLVAPDDFKGTLSAPEVAEALAHGLRAAGAEAVELPVADGGDGTLDVLLSVLGGVRRTEAVSDPLGRLVEAEWGLLPGGRTAVVEMARASGLRHVSEGERDAWTASTRGTGELIAAAAQAGAAEVLVAVGGSATTDGGAGAVEALDAAGASPRLTVICDVQTAWEDAPALFGPQKGADPETVGRLERRLEEMARRAPRDPRGVVMTGCAGGLSGGLWAFRDARLVAGAAYVLDALDFDRNMRASRFVVTGEGKLDAQTMTGKAVAEVATRCRQGGVVCHAVAGRSELDLFRVRILDLASVREAGTLDELEAAGRALALP